MAAKNSSRRRPGGQTGAGNVSSDVRLHRHPDATGELAAAPRSCSWCKGPLPPRRRRFCCDDHRRRGQKSERVIENSDYADGLNRQIRKMGTRASGDVDALGWLAGAVEYAREALAMAVDGCRARGYSDAEIGAVLGITRQAVWKRFSRQPKVGTRPAESGAAG